MPLGGIGAGSLELRPDGHFYRWCLMNNKPWGSGDETAAMEGVGLRFGARCDWGGGPRCLALGTHRGLDPKGDGWFWMSDPYHLPWVRHARRIGYRASIPFAELAYEFDDVPIRIDLAAWSPFIPYRPAEANTPGAVLRFSVANPTARPCTVALMGLLKNAVGYDHPHLPSACRVVEEAPAGVVFSRPGLAADANTAGTMGLFAATRAPATVSRALHAPHGRALWDALISDGRLDDRDYGRQGGRMGEVGAEVDSAGPTGLTRSALCVDFTVPAGEAVEVAFYLTWHFPNFRELPGRRGEVPRCIGVQYARRFGDAVDVARYLAREGPRLEAEARSFHDAFHRSSLPAWLLRAVGAGWSVLLRSAWWDAAGCFAVWEGLGCCGMQTIDVAHYASLPILEFFPELEAAQNRLSAANCEPSGKVPHLMPGHFGCSDYSGGRGRIDLPAQFVLAVWRNASSRGQLDLAEQLWPVVERNMEVLAETDTDGDGLPNNEGPDQTYDRFPIHGTSAYVGVLYLAALRAAADLAERLARRELAERYRSAADRAAPELDRQLFNGQYYNLSCDCRSGRANTGCMTDQLNGDWFWRQTTGRGLMDDDRVRSALRAVLRHNRRTAGQSAWLANCTWPAGGDVKIVLHGSDQANCPWSGVEYAVAAHMILLGLRDEGRRVAWDTFRRYEDAGMRYNHVECGENYYRALAVWAVYQAEFGLAYDGFEQRLFAAPPEGDAAFLVTVPGGCAAAEWSEAAGTLVMEGLFGRLNVRALCFRGRHVAHEAVALSPGEKATIAVRPTG